MRTAWRSSTVPPAADASAASARCRPSSDAGRAGREREPSAAVRDLEHPRARGVESVDACARDRYARAGRRRPSRRSTRAAAAACVDGEPVERREPEQRARTSPPTSRAHHVEHVVAIRSARCDPTTRASLSRWMRDGGFRSAGALSRIGSGSFGGQARSRPRRVTTCHRARASGSVAASTASRNAARTPCASSACEPGRGGAARRRDRGAERLRGLAALGEQRRRAEQRLARRARRRSRAASPTSTPASIIASASRNTYAGPEPERPVTASSWASGTRTTMPDRAEQPLGELEVRVVGAACRPRSRRRPCPTSAAVFGIARTTGRPGRAASTSAIVTPAAIDSTSACSGERSATQASSAPATSPGFTATTTTSASATAHAGLGTTRTPGKRSSRTRRRSASTSATASVSRLPAGVEQARRRAPRPSARRRGARGSSASG